MASKNIIYKVNGVPTPEQVEKYNNESDIFFRFQEPHQKLTSRSKSWGMIFGSKEEALRDAEEWGYTEDNAILPGKSCYTELKDLRNVAESFDKDYVVLVFKGSDTGINGHDNEWVATYYKKVAVWSYDDVIEFINKNYYAHEMDNYEIAM